MLSGSCKDFVIIDVEMLRVSSIRHRTTQQDGRPTLGRNAKEVAVEGKSVRLRSARGEHRVARDHLHPRAGP